jgi:predicted Fe-S protein YdhL (DUF1289 family)
MLIQQILIENSLCRGCQLKCHEIKAVNDHTPVEGERREILSTGY